VFGGVGTIVVVLAVMARWPQLLSLGPLHSLGKTVPSPATEARPSGSEAPAEAPAS
jgi:hypothetical protein